jgi:hypothetical protein
MITILDINFFDNVLHTMKQSRFVHMGLEAFFASKFSRFQEKQKHIKDGQKLFFFEYLS